MPNKPQTKSKKKSDELQSKGSLHPSVLAALIGLIGIIITAYFSYLSSSRSTEIIIESTKNAKFESTTSNVTPTYQMRGSSVLGVQTMQTGPWPVMGYPIVPDTIDAYAPDGIEEINKALVSGEISNWSISGHFNDWILLDIENKSIENKWIRLDKSIKVNIEVLSTIPKNIIAIGQTWGQGGADYYKFMPEINLTGADDRYSQTVFVSGDNSFDYYSLQPGEFTEFYFNLSCK
jgi:hypothetical protein